MISCIRSEIQKGFNSIFNKVIKHTIFNIWTIFWFVLSFTGLALWSQSLLMLSDDVGLDSGCAKPSGGARS